MKWSLSASLGLAALTGSVSAHAKVRSDPWTEQFGGTPDLSFSGITTFAHLPHERCLDNINGAVDVAILGVPYDNAVSYRPGQFLPPTLSSSKYCPCQVILPAGD